MGIIDESAIRYFYLYSAIKQCRITVTGHLRKALGAVKRQLGSHLGGE